MMLYVIVAEPLKNLIKSQPNIKGIVINDNFKSLLFQHADDTSITVQDTQSVESVFHTVNTFCLGTVKKVAFRIKLLNKYFNSDFKAVWKHTMSEFLRRYMNINLTHKNFNIVFNESGLTNINPFYADVLQAWDSFTKCKRFLSVDLNEMLSQPLFHNPLITYNSNLLSLISYIESGIVTVADIAYASLCNSGNC